jgi:hypothetical protein
MSLSKSKSWYSNNCLHFLKCGLFHCVSFIQTQLYEKYCKDNIINFLKKSHFIFTRCLEYKTSYGRDQFSIS